MTEAIATRERTGRWWRVRRDIFERWLAAQTEHGPGWFLKTDLYDEASGSFHHAFGRRFLGIDVDERVVRAAHARLRIQGLDAELIAADVRHLPFRSGSMSTTFSLSTLDHFTSVDHIRMALDQLRRTLSPQGRLFLVLDNPRNPEVAMRSRLPDRVRNVLRADRFALGVLLGTGEASRLLTSSGFIVTTQGYAIHAPRYLAIRLLDLLDGLGLSGTARWVERIIRGLERLDHLPSRSFTGHYITWVAEANGHANSPSKYDL